MVKRLDPFDRDILEFRPSIGFIEPDTEEQVIEAQEDPLQFEDVQEGRRRVRQLAQAVNTMAAAVQARADQRASTLVINLDTNVDQETIQAMRRKFPESDPTNITYQQYRQVRDDIRNRGLEAGRQSIIQAEEVAQSRDDINTFIPGGFGTDQANTGGLRPELDNRSTIIPPLNLESLQIDLICILVNFAWKNFIKPGIQTAALASLVGGIVAGIIEAVPDQLCDPGGGIEIPGLLILGDQPDDLLTGKVAAEQAAEVGL